MYYLRVRKNILIFVLSVLLNSCAVLTEDLTQAKQYVEQNNYNEAIKILNAYKSRNSKSYNAKVHMMLAEKILKNLERPKLERYEEAKKYYEQAVKLDPKNKKARTFYLMILKLERQA